MKKILFMATMACLLFIASSCQSDDPNHIKEEALKDELMVIHDEVMPKMGEVNKLRNELVTLSEKSNTTDSLAIASIKETIQYLEQADEGMMDWMGEFKRPSKLRKSKTHEEILAYLEDEKQKVQKVKEDINGSIEAAVAILEEYKKAE